MPPALTATAARDVALRFLGFVRPVTMARLRVLSRARQAMTTRDLTIEKSHNLESGAWFFKLSQTLRNAILARARVQRDADGALVANRGASAEEWHGMAWQCVTGGAVRVSSVSDSLSGS